MHAKPVFDTSVATAMSWVGQVASKLALKPDESPRALRALRAGLHAIRDRLPPAEVVQLAAQLPTLVRGIYYDGWTLRNDPGRIGDRTAMLARVRSEIAHDDRLSERSVLKAVIQVLCSHVSRGEIDDITATLPRSIAALWVELESEVATSDGASPLARAPRVERSAGDREC